MKKVTLGRVAFLAGLVFLTFGAARADQIVYPQAAVGPFENSAFEIHLRLGNTNQDEPWQGTIRLLRQTDLAAVMDLVFRDEDNQTLQPSSGTLSIQIPPGQSKMYRISASTLQVGVLLLEAESGSTTIDLVDSFYYFLIGASGQVSDVIAVQGQRDAHQEFQVMMSSVPTFMVGVAVVAARSLPRGGSPSPNPEPTPVTMTVILKDGQTFVGDPVILEVGADHKLQQALFPTEIIPQLPLDASIAQLKIESPEDIYVTTLAVGAPPAFEDVQIGAAAAALDGGGLSSVVAGGPITGDGTSDNPLRIEDEGITSALLADSAVSTVKLADAAVTGAKIAGQAISTAKLEDGAVTGAKIADGALVAGQNVALSRQAGGSIEIASSGLSLPYSGSVASITAAFRIENTSTGDGIYIDGAGDDGVEVASAQYGFYVEHASSEGFLVNTAGHDGVYISRADQVGLRVESSGSHGLLINQAGTNGIQVNQAGTNGIQVGTTTFDGIQIQDAGRDGIRVSGAGGLAGRFEGDVSVSGTLTKGGGAFKIDHPLDPGNKYLQHSFVESPDMMDVYNGNVTLNAAGEAVVELPDYFEALNRDFRYQLTAIGAPGPYLYVAEEIQGNQFRIAGGAPGMKVSWQVTGVRQDPWANAHRIVVEEDKPADERGYYLHPTLYGQPETQSLVRSDTPETGHQGTVNSVTKGRARAQRP